MITPCGSSAAGLSPLARGTRAGDGATAVEHRFIPAGAGNTMTTSLIPGWMPVYPRWRGEHSQNCRAWSRCCGLSPLARGTLIGLGVAGMGLRFIPAGAGNTGAGVSGRDSGAVYPRWRGEHVPSACRSPGSHGLSPLARGTPHTFKHRVRVLRFIPAGAGNTRPFPRIVDVCSVYPRWRGEHRDTGARISRLHGLSPLARGTHVGSEQDVPDRRFIPAGAGNTQIHSSLVFNVPVYPRWRGEHASDIGLPDVAIGLSPLARGTL